MYVTPQARARQFKPHTNLFFILTAHAVVVTMVVKARIISAKSAYVKQGKRLANHECSTLMKRSRRTRKSLVYTCTRLCVNFLDCIRVLAGQRRVTAEARTVQFFCRLVKCAGCLLTVVFCNSY